MIGPCEFDPPASTDVGWLDGIDRPIVLVATSTERQNDARLGLVAIEAMAAEPVHVVATFPCGVPEAVTVPPNATVPELVGDLTPVKLRASVLRAMSMVDGARRVAEGFAATGGVGRGADLLESRLLAR